MPEAAIDKLRRKRDQAWENAGCARRDGDLRDEMRWIQEARKLSEAIGRVVREESTGEEEVEKLNPVIRSM